MAPVIAIGAAVASVAAEAVAGIALAGEALLAGEAIAGGIGLSEGIIGLGGLEAVTAGEALAGLGAVEAGLGFGDSIIGLGGLESAGALEGAAGLVGGGESLAGLVGEDALGWASLSDAASGVIADGSLVADATSGSILGAGNGELVSALASDGVQGAVGSNIIWPVQQPEFFQWSTFPNAYEAISEPVLGAEWGTVPNWEGISTSLETFAPETAPTFTDVSGANYLSGESLASQGIDLQAVENAAIDITPGATGQPYQPPVGLETNNFQPFTNQPLPGEVGDVLTETQRNALAQQQWTQAGQPGSPFDIATKNLPNIQTAPAGNVDWSLANDPFGPEFPGASAPIESSPLPPPTSATLGEPVAAPSVSSAPVAPSASPVGAPVAPGPTAMSATSTGGESSFLSKLIPSPTQLAIGLGGNLLLSSVLGGGQQQQMTAAGSAATDPNLGARLSPGEIALRRYLGASSDPYNYGYGAERRYYAAEGGYFNADQYFANGGLVSPMQPPSQSTVPPFPTMAFTDGGGPVGSIAQPPGLAPSDAVGSDAPHASPMAPSPAASIPTMTPGLQTLSMRNINGIPAPSPISQNPNVGYALGKSPLSNL